MGLLNKLLLGVAAGAGTAYLLDPEHGTRVREALRKNAAGLLEQVGVNGESLTAERIQSALTSPLSPTMRLWSGFGGALAWLVGSRVRSLRCYKMGTLGTLLLYRAIANAPLVSSAEAKKSTPKAAKSSTRKTPQTAP